jgi:hypothetical protein
MNLLSHSHRAMSYRSWLLTPKAARFYAMVISLIGCVDWQIYGRLRAQYR